MFIFAEQGRKPNMFIYHGGTLYNTLLTERIFLHPNKKDEIVFVFPRFKAYLAFENQEAAETAFGKLRSGCDGL
jgi:hypothetical protein